MELGRPDAEIRRIDRNDWRTPDMRANDFLGLSDALRIYRAGSTGHDPLDFCFRTRLNNALRYSFVDITLAFG
jgi:hypothetical protein